MSDVTVSLKSESFESFIESNEIVFVDYWAPWCAPCRQFGTVYEKIAANNSEIKFAKVNIEEEEDISEIFSIRSIPHIMVFKKGIVIYSEAGSMPESTLQELVEQAKNADVSGIQESIKSEDDKK